MLNYWIGRNFSHFVLKLFYRFKTAGRENIPQKGGYILAANHDSLIDPPLVAAASPRPLHFMAKESLFDIPLLGPFIRGANAFPVRRGAADKGAIKKSLKLLRSGERLLIFPEGGRFESGRALRGISFLAHKASVPVVPVGLVNNYDLHRFRRIYVNIGKPVTFKTASGEKKGGREYDEFARRILNKIYILKSDRK